MAVTLKEYIYNCYNSRYGRFNCFCTCGYPEVELTDSVPFVKYFKIDLTKDILEIPCIYKYPVMSTLEFNFHNPAAKVDTLYVPMMCLSNDPQEVKSSNPLIKKFFYETAPEANLTRKKASGTVYLGGEGFIAYEDYTPLVMLTLEVKREDANRYTPLRQIIRINPIIYSRDDLIAKYLRTKFLTGVFEMRLSQEALDYVNYGIRRRLLRNLYNLLTSVQVNYDFKVRIEDFSNFFFTPKAPDITFNSEEIQTLLSNDTDFMKEL